MGLHIEKTNLFCFVNNLKGGDLCTLQNFEFEPGEVESAAWLANHVAKTI